MSAIFLAVLVTITAPPTSRVVELDSVTNAFYAVPAFTITTEPYELIDHIGGTFTGIGFITTEGKHGTLAGTKRTVIYSRHHSPTNGVVVHFGEHWAIVDRVVTGALDCVVAYLDRDIPIEPVLLAPANWGEYLEVLGAPCVYVTKYKEIVESELIGPGHYVNLHSFSVGSNSPLFLVVDGVPVMVGNITAFPNQYASSKWYDIDAPRGWYKSSAERVDLSPVSPPATNSAPESASQPSGLPPPIPQE